MDLDYWMKELYFTSPYRRSLRTVRLEYGQVKKVFILRTFEGGINGKGESESPPKEEVFDEEQEMLKKVYETKSGLLEGRWIVQNKQSISQPSFISTNVMDGEVSVEFEQLNLVMFNRTPRFTIHFMKISNINKHLCIFN